jgi:hypothetical protein
VRTDNQTQTDTAFLKFIFEVVKNQKHGQNASNSLFIDGALLEFARSKRMVS